MIAVALPRHIDSIGQEQLPCITAYVTNEEGSGEGGDPHDAFVGCLLLFMLFLLFFAFFDPLLECFFYFVTIIHNYSPFSYTGGCYFRLVYGFLVPEDGCRRICFAQFYRTRFGVADHMIFGVCNSFLFAVAYLLSCTSFFSTYFRLCFAQRHIRNS